MPTHWDYPELVTGYMEALKGGRGIIPPDENAAAEQLIGVQPDLAVAFCRASLWVAEGVDVMFLNSPRGWAIGGVLRKASGKDTVTRARYAWEKSPGTGSQRGGHSLDEALQEAMGLDEAGGCSLPDVLEEVAYQHWLGLFEVLAPHPRRDHPFAPGGTSPEWRVMQALERNTDMSRDVARRRKGPGTAPRPDWEGLTRRLRLRVELLSAAQPGPRLPRPRPRGRSRSRSRTKTRSRSSRSDLTTARGRASESESGEPPPGTADDSQRSVDRVTYLGGVMLPLSIVSGVLSMNEDFSPGGRLFWVFWIASVPLAVLATLVIYADKLRLALVWVPVPVDRVVVGDRSSSGSAASALSSAWPSASPHGPDSTRSRRSGPAVLEGDAVIDMGTPAGQQAVPETGESVPASTAPSSEEAGQQLNRAWRTQRLGWGGAVLSILGVRKPLRVSEGKPEGAVEIPSFITSD